MITETKDTADQSIGALVGGIVGDARQLVQQHVDLLKQEIREDIGKVKRTGFAMMMALIMAIVGCAFVTAMLVGLLAATLPQLPWWAWSGIVGGLMLVLSAVVFAVAKSKMEAINMIPDQSVRTIKEDMQWLKQQTTP